MNKMKVNLIVGYPTLTLPELEKIGELDEVVLLDDGVEKIHLHPSGPGYYQETGNYFSQFTTVAILKLNNLAMDAELFDLDFINNESNNYAQWHDDFCGKWLVHDPMGEKLNIVSVEDIIRALDLQVQVFLDPNMKPASSLDNLISALSYLNSVPANNGYGILIYLDEIS